MRGVAALLLALAVLAVANYVGSYFYPGGYLFAQGTSSVEPSLGPVALLAGLMLVGIVSSFVFERAKAPESLESSIRTNFGKALTDFRLIAALFVSPMIFNSVYALVGQAPDSVSDYLLAYQNGFFWQTILSGLAENISRQSPAK